MSKQPVNKILDDLNNRQREAAATIEGPLLIVAGAGSGKTKTLTHRLAYILSQKNALSHSNPADTPPGAASVRPVPFSAEPGILAITFTNKAAQEMRTRVQTLLRANDIIPRRAPFIGTFHSFGAKVLRATADAAGRSRNFSIYDDDDSLALIKSIVKEMSLDKERYSPAALRHEIGRIKNELISPADHEASAHTPLEKASVDVYRAYEAALAENNAFDFDDLIEKPVRILQNHPAIRARLQDEYRYILVDEYQDTNVAQYVLIKLLAEKHKNICVVGDDAQAIYGWRWADFRNFLNFDNDWSQTKTVLLEQNYRSTQNVLAAADAIISKNILQKKKTLWTENERGEPIRVVECGNEKIEGVFIVNTIVELMETKGLQPKDIGVFYRTNAQSRVLEESFLEAGIPYQIIGGVKFYGRKEIKDVVAYLRVIDNPNDKVSLERIVAVPPRGITARRLRAINYDLAAIPVLQQLFDNFRLLAQNLTVSELIVALVRKIRYKEYLEKEFPNADERWENVMELLSLARTFEERMATEDQQAIADGHGLALFLETIHLIQDNESRSGADPNQVSLMTIHSAKGLEFDMVFVSGCEEGLLPHARSLIDSEELEEERRLAYVAITRARNQLYLLFTRSRLLFGLRGQAVPSHFLFDIPPEVTEFVSGNSIFGDDDPHHRGNQDDDEQFIDYDDDF